MNNIFTPAANIYYRTIRSNFLLSVCFLDPHAYANVCVLSWTHMHMEMYVCFLGFACICECICKPYCFMLPTWYALVLQIH